MQVPSVMYGFLFWCFLVCVVALHSTDQRQRWFIMAALVAGAIGGAAIDPAYVDFWQPGWWPSGSMLFGIFYLGSFVSGCHWWIARSDEALIQEYVKTASRMTKVLTLIGVAASWWVQWQILGWNSVFATANSLLLGTFVVWLWRMAVSGENIAFAAFVGSVVSCALFGVMVGGYLLALRFLIDLGGLATTVSSFYAKHGAGWTAAVLIYWAITFGAFGGIMLVWGRNLRFRHPTLNR